MDRLKVVTVVGTRPEIIRLSIIIKILDKYCNHTLVHTGQNYDYELNEIFFNDLKIRKPDVFLNCADGNKLPTDNIAQTIAATSRILMDVKPDAFLVLGDTNSSLSVISAKRLKIPIFHMEAGNRCYDQRVPEEINRRIVDHVSDINLTYSSIARDNLLRENLPPDRVIKIGSPMLEVLNHFKSEINKSKILSKLELKNFDYFLVSLHREENVDDPTNLKKFVSIFNALSDNYGLPVVISVHPRTRKHIDSLGLNFAPTIRLLKPQGYFDYVKLQMNAKVVLSDSGTITEESSILNFPALNLREAHERLEGMEEGAVMMVGRNLDRIVSAVEILEQQSRERIQQMNIVKDYNVDNVSEKVLRIILSYTDYVNRVVWSKY